MKSRLNWFRIIIMSRTFTATIKLSLRRTLVHSVVLIITCYIEIIIQRFYKHNCSTPTEPLLQLFCVYKG